MGEVGYKMARKAKPIEQGSQEKVSRSKYSWDVLRGDDSEIYQYMRPVGHGKEGIAYGEMTY